VRAQDLLPLVRAWRLELLLACSPYVASHEFPLIFSDLKIPHSIFVEKEIVFLDAFIPT